MLIFIPFSLSLYYDDDDDLPFRPRQHTHNDVAKATTQLPSSDVSPKASFLVTSVTSSAPRIGSQLDDGAVYYERSGPDEFLARFHSCARSSVQALEVWARGHVLLQPAMMGDSIVSYESSPSPRSNASWPPRDPTSSAANKSDLRFQSSISLAF